MTETRSPAAEASGAGSRPPHQMWGGRFTAPPSEALAALNNSLPIDRRLWPQDIRGSQAWVEALARAGVVSDDERDTLRRGLDRVARRIEGGAADAAADEDIHTLVERLLYEEVGAVAGKLHTGRSRNDQVVTDLRLWTLEVLAAVDREVTALGASIVSRARSGVDMLLPGYTHGQQAQPLRWGYVLLAHAWPLVRDRARLSELQRRVAELPLGSGALAGSGVPVDREFLREALGFRAVSRNALDATGDRDFVAEALFALTLIATHLSRLAGELITYCSSEYGFVRLADDYATGSSLMPQKRNPDVFELARGKASGVLGSLVGMLGLLRGLPAGYSKDLQDDKVHLFQAVDTVLATVVAVRGAVETLQPVPARMAAALHEGLLATDVADALVARGVPFREAHRVAGGLVRRAEALSVPLSGVPAESARALHPELPEVLATLGSFADSTDRRVTVGGSSRPSVLEQIEELDALFGG